MINKRAALVLALGATVLVPAACNRAPTRVGTVQTAPVQREIYRLLLELGAIERPLRPGAIYSGGVPVVGARATERAAR